MGHAGGNDRNIHDNDAYPRRSESTSDARMWAVGVAVGVYVYLMCGSCMYIENPIRSPSPPPRGRL